MVWWPGFIISFSSHFLSSFSLHFLFYKMTEIERDTLYFLSLSSSCSSWLGLPSLRSTFKEERSLPQDLGWRSVRQSPTPTCIQRLAMVDAESTCSTQHPMTDLPTCSHPFEARRWLGYNVIDGSWRYQSYMCSAESQMSGKSTVQRRNSSVHDSIQWRGFVMLLWMGVYRD
jgi:hypothetical protein